MSEVGIPYVLETPAGDLTFNPSAGANGYYLTDVTGMGAAVRSSSSPRPQADGAIVYDAFRGELAPVLQGYIKCAQPGDSEATALAARSALIDDLRAAVYSLMREDGLLRFTPSGESERQLMGVRQLERPDIAGNQGLVKQFSIMLITGDPIAYAAGTASTVQRTNTGTVAAVNSGNVPTLPVIRVEGPWTSSSSIVVTNTTTGLSWTVTGTSASDGDYIEADHKAETLVNASGASYLQYLEPASSEFFPLEPGSNTISLAGSGMTSSTTFTVTWRHGWA